MILLTIFLVDLYLDLVYDLNMMKQNDMLSRILPDLISEVAPHLFVTEASDLGWPCGHWPERIETTMGNGLALIRTSKQVRDGDLLFVRYIQEFGCMQLKVFND